MVIAADKKQYTAAEYLEFEANAEDKHEYQDGEIVLMAGGTTNHNKLTGQFYAAILSTIEAGDYDVYVSDVRLWIPDYNQYTYPNVMGVEGEAIYHPPGTTTITNPCLIAEVLSLSTQGYDRGNKFRYYRSIPEFREYLLIDQYSIFVEHYLKTADKKWILTEYEGNEAILRLETIPFEISLGDLYRRVDFT